MGLLTNQKTPIIFFIAVFTLAVSGCATKKVRAENQPADAPAISIVQMGVSGEMGPPLPPQEAPGIPSAQGPVGPSPGPGYVPPKDGYVLILGPGLARGLAYLGVIRELEEHQLAINAILGVEIGAVIAGIWASSNTNSLEWEMHKFTRATLLDYPMLGLRNSMAEGKKLYSFLDEAVKVTLLKKMKIPVLIASSALDSVGEDLIIENSGSSRDIIRAAMGIPGILKPFSIDFKERMTAAFEAPFPIVQAKALGVGKTICVDVVGKGNNFIPKEAVEEHLSALMRAVATVARPLLKECDVLLSIPTDGISYLNFEVKADLIYKGRLAVKKWLGEPI